MKVEEIQIGDWVQNPLGWRAQVRGIRRTQAITDEFEWRVRIGLNDDTFTDLSLGEIKPIRLTTEILEKNFPTAGELAWWPVEDGLHCESRNTEDIMVSGVFRFVHDLQHALRLCGIDKSIEL